MIQILCRQSNPIVEKEPKNLKHIKHLLFFMLPTLRAWKNFLSILSIFEIQNNFLQFNGFDRDVFIKEKNISYV